MNATRKSSRMRVACGLGSILLVALAAPALCQTPPEPQQTPPTTQVAAPAVPPAPPATVPDAPAEPDPALRRYVKQNDNVALGAKPTTPGIRKLSEMGFKTILNVVSLREGSMMEAKTVEFYGMNFVNVECNFENLSMDTINEFAAAVEKKENQPIYVHCGDGNRAAAVWMIYRVKKQGWKMDAALEEAKKNGLEGPARDAALKFLGSKTAA